MISVNNLAIEPRLLPLSINVAAGEKLHVIGPNGSGKSTLLAAIAGMLTYNGEVTINERSVHQCNLSELATIRAYLPQSGVPAFNMSVFHYLSLSIPQSAEASLVEKAIQTITHELAIESKLTKSIHHLSGGEWQRVRIAAVCIQAWPSINPHARMMLLDEPAAPLDVGQQSSLYKMMDLMSQQGLCVVVANHDLNRTLHHADNVLVLKSGIVKAYGKAEEVLTDSLVSQVFDSDVSRIEHQGRPFLIFN
ncbi:vitamin B12 ABC transporter ATP-binding protein BtuD [Vibrio gangliei]|uniref:vitamin B12 ABC transporter ATP-binding protein BtuD n=1 Tax=Vibrio gangliei TaxID=2077090 RepID=UPI000D01700A|nr:vitamin B12 ABC transporter ATP-binding protein BtuD [Vibrio gangliei]